MSDKTTISSAVVTLLGPIVSSRVYRNVFPQPPASPVWPAIRYSFPSVTPYADMCGDGGEEVADFRLQLDVVILESKGPSAFLNLCAQVKSAMATLAPIYVWDGDFEEFDLDTKTNKMTIDYVVYLSSED